MYIKVTNVSGKKYIQLVQSYREGTKVKQKVISNLGRIDVLSQLGLIELLPKIESLLSGKEPKKQDKSGYDISTLKEISRLNYGYIAYKKLWDSYSLSRILDRIAQRKKIGYNLSETVFQLVVNRLLTPSSKLHHYQTKAQYIFTEAQEGLHNIYRGLSILSENKNEIEEYIFEKNKNLFNMQTDIVFYDVTTYHYESQKSDEIRDFGFSKANKINEVQVVMGLIIDKEGRPIGYEIFSGSTTDVKTMLPILKKLKKQFNLDQVIIVADKGMNSKENLAKIKEAGYNYIVSTRIRSMGKQMQERILDKQGYKNKLEGKEEGYSYKVLDYKNIIKTCEGKIVEIDEKMVCSYSPKRANKDRKDRERGIEKAAKCVEGNNTSSMINKRGYRKYLKLDEGNNSKKSSLSLDKKKIEDDSLFDGYYAIEYSKLDMTAEEVINQYHQLYKIEESFRVLKSTFNTRPIYVWTEEHIQGHFIICFFAFLLQRALEVRLKKEYSAERIKEALLSMEVSQIEVDGEQFYLRSNHDKLASTIFKNLRINLPPNILPQKKMIEYISEI